MIVLFVVVSFVTGCVDRMCQLFLSECVFCLNYSFWPCHYVFLTFPSLWEIGFSSQMMSETVIWLLDLHRIFK